jgi:hypothetical protein
MTRVGLLFAGTVLCAGAAIASTQSAVFSGTVLSTCSLTVGSAGVITSNAGGTTLSSNNSGGSSSVVTAIATGASFNVTAEAPSSFTVGNSTNVTFAATYDLTGATSATGVSGAVQTLLGVGSTTVDVDLTATKSSGVFEAGAYSASVTVRCE